MSSSITSLVTCAALIAALVPAANAERHFSAPAPPQKARPIESLTPGIVPSAHVALPAIDASTLRSVREKNSRADGAVQVGIVREVPLAAASTARALEWQRVAGGRAAQWRVQADGARAVRVALDVRTVAPGVVARFSSPSGEAFSAPLAARGLAWSPLMLGSEAIVELFAPEGVRTSALDISIARVADHFADPTLPDAIAKSQWLAAPCQVDLVCEANSDPVLASAGAASIKLNWIEGYSAYACSGTLLNPADGSFRPYVYTAAHCIATQAAANSLVTLWFYEKAACGGDEARNAVQLAGGAVLLATDSALDATLLRLNRTPPAGAVYSGWDTTAPSPGESLTALHHANGEVTKVSHGVVVAPPAYPRFALAWTSGIVQGGSSGSGAFSRIGGPKADLLVRGALSSGNASCSAPGYGYYSSLDTAWTKIAPWLTVAPEHANATGLWWDAREPGWGVSVSQQGEVAFAVLFTYRDDGSAAWLVASELRREAAGTFAGTLFRASAKGVTQAGSLRLALADANAATLEYTVDGVTTRKSISRQVFSSAAPICVGTATARGDATNFQDLWWNPAEAGWGLGLAQQGDTIFATLFTYDGDGEDTWLVASNMAREADGAYSGTLYRTSLAAANGTKAVKAAPAGSLRIAFADGEHGTATMTIDGRLTTKPITRQVFGTTPPLCR